MDSQPDRKKRTITEIRESKKTGEKMVYTSVPDYTSARWAEMAGVDDTVRKRHIRNCLKADPAYGEGVAKALGIALQDVEG